MANEKMINTRIQLKYDSYENWQNSTLTLKAGEIAIAYLTTDKAVKPGTTDTQHPVLFKVGPGKFSELPWASALAADVYEWAKCQTVELDGEVIKFHNGNKNAPVHSINLSKFALDEDLGNVDDLTTTHKNTVVGAINEHDTEIGNLGALNTTNKSNLVAAINEAL